MSQLKGQLCSATAHTVLAVSHLSIFKLRTLNGGDRPQPDAGDYGQGRKRDKYEKQSKEEELSQFSFNPSVVYLGEKCILYYSQKCIFKSVIFCPCLSSIEKKKVGFLVYKKEKVLFFS